LAFEPLARRTPVPRPTRSATRYEDLLGLPENLVGEIIDGELHTHPRPAPKHARAYSALGYRIGGPYDGGIDGPGGWWILDEPELHLGSDVLVPDLASWRRERLPRLPESAWFELAPDWVCEILSPSTARVDRVLKMPIYAREGVGHLWLVDPDLETLEVYALVTRAEKPHWLLLESLANDAPVRQAPFHGIEFPLASLWG
jgi:Uma2 family endonuclease